jgi:putative transposase
MSKSDKIKESLKKTRQKRKSQTCKVFEIKIDESKLSNEKLRKLNDCFVQSKWIYNHLLSQEKDVKFDPKSKNINVNVFNEKTQKCDKVENRNLTIGSQIKQSICERFVKNIISLSKLKGKGFKIGKLKFKKEVNSVPLKQFGCTYRIIDNKTIRIQSIGELKVNGLEQIVGLEKANAHLIKKTSGYYIKITCYKEKENLETFGNIGIDFGIKDSIVLSDGRKFSWNFEIPDKLKRKQKKLSKKKKGSRNYVKQCKKIEKNYEEYTRKKDDAANKFVSSLKEYSKVVIQDENIVGWHSNLFGKQVQQSILGRIKSRIKNLGTSIIIDRWLPTTKLSPVSGENVEIGLNDRIFVDRGFSEDRDIKSAKTILTLGLFDSKLTSKELRSLPVEDLISAFERFYPFESKLGPMNQEAPSFKAG